MKTKAELIKKIELLESLGFKIVHEDSNVLIDGLDLEFDFSATGNDTKNIIRNAIFNAYKMGIEDGKERLQHKLKDLLNIRQ